MFNEVVFWGLPVHFDPFSFIVAVVAAIAGILALVFIYKEYCSNHRYIIKVLDIRSGLQTFSRHEFRPFLSFKFQNRGLSIEEIAVELVIRFTSRPRYTTQWFGRYLHPMQQKQQLHEVTLTRGMMLEYELNAMDFPPGNVPTAEDINNAQISIIICSGKYQIAEIAPSLGIWRLRWNRLAYGVNSRLRRNHTMPNGEVIVIDRNFLPVANVFGYSLKSYVLNCVLSNRGQDFTGLFQIPTPKWFTWLKTGGETLVFTGWLDAIEFKLERLFFDRKYKGNKVKETPNSSIRNKDSK